MYAEAAECARGRSVQSRLSTTSPRIVGLFRKLLRKLPFRSLNGPSTNLSLSFEPDQEFGFRGVRNSTEAVLALSKGGEVWLKCGPIRTPGWSETSFMIYGAITQEEGNER